MLYLFYFIQFFFSYSHQFYISPLFFCFFSFILCGYVLYIYFFSLLKKNHPNESKDFIGVENKKKIKEKGKHERIERNEQRKRQTVLIVSLNSIIKRIGIGLSKVSKSLTVALEADRSLQL